MEKFIPECVQAAKMIRKDLKAAFPGVKFSVNTHRYSMGNSIRVEWIDGPSYESVERLTDKYEDGDFDGMTDCYNYRPNPDNIPRTKYLFLTRNLSPLAAEKIEALRSEKFGQCFESEYHKEKQAYEIAKGLSL